MWAAPQHHLKKEHPRKRGAERHEQRGPGGQKEPRQLHRQQQQPFQHTKRPLVLQQRATKRRPEHTGMHHRNRLATVAPRNKHPCHLNQLPFPPCLNKPPLRKDKLLHRRRLQRQRQHLPLHRHEPITPQPLQLWPLLQRPPPLLKRQRLHKAGALPLPLPTTLPLQGAQWRQLRTAAVLQLLRLRQRLPETVHKAEEWPPGHERVVPDVEQVDVPAFAFDPFEARPRQPRPPFPLAARAEEPD